MSDPPTDPDHDDEDLEDEPIEEGDLVFALNEKGETIAWVAGPDDVTGTPTPHPDHTDPEEWAAFETPALATPFGPRPPINGTQLRTLAQTWRGIGVLFVILAAVGSIAIGVTAAPVNDTLYGAEKDTLAGFAIGTGVFVGSLVTILPYFLLTRLMDATSHLLDRSEAAE